MGRRAITVAAVGVIIVVAMVGAWVRYRDAPSRNALTTATSVAHGAGPNTARATFGIQMRGKPTRVEARILSGDAVFYRRAVAPDYGEPLEDCVYPVHLALASETGEN